MEKGEVGAGGDGPGGVFRSNKPRDANAAAAGRRVLHGRVLPGARHLGVTNQPPAARILREGVEPAAVEVLVVVHQLRRPPPRVCSRTCPSQFGGGGSTSSSRKQGRVISRGPRMLCMSLLLWRVNASYTHTHSWHHQEEARR